MGLRGNSGVRANLAAAGYAASLCGSVISASHAQVGAIEGAGGPPPVSTGRADVFAPPGRAEHALIVGDWLLYPSAFGGVVYDTNPSQSAAGSHSSAGLRVVPSMLAESGNENSKTTLYGLAD